MSNHCALYRVNLPLRIGCTRQVKPFRNLIIHRFKTKNVIVLNPKQPQTKHNFFVHLVTSIV